MVENKPIIIDGIEVSKCEFLIINNDKQLCRCIKSDLFGGIEFVENAKNGNCKDNPNCYYKQLQREKQNSQEARDIAIKKFNRAEELKTLLKRKEQECEEYKAQAKKYLADYYEENKKCEELKKTIMYKCPQCGDEYLSPIGASLYEENNKFKQTLAEIKEIAKNMNKECFYDDFDCKDCDMKNGCTYFNKKQILQKISEVEND